MALADRSVISSSIERAELERGLPETQSDRPAAGESAASRSGADRKQQLWPRAELG
jgi:hypothetical protein